MYLRIWTAAIKYIKSQSDKGRIVDTKLIGQFCKNEEASHYMFIPSQELLDHCKIRLSSNYEN
jgi:hypothetical protein